MAKKKLIAVHLVYAGALGEPPTQPGELFTVDSAEEAGKLVAAGAAKEPTEETEAALKAKAKADARAKAEAEAKTKAEADAKAKAEAEAKAKAEAEAKAKAEADAKAQAEAEAKAREETEARNKAFATLLGSSIQPPVLQIRGADVQLGTVVASAHQRSGLTVEGWNAQPEAVREALITDEITVLAMAAQ